MINGIIKLFYSEIVKTKMKGMSSSDYTLRDECKEIRNITLKIDSMFLKFIKLMMAMVILILAFNINTILGVGTFLIEIAYIIYKVKLEKQVRETIENLKNNIELPKIDIVSERSKSGLNVLIMILLIGLITEFNISIVVSFMLVFIFTIKDIYSNIK
jgi:Ca2+/Na+ antiporter